MFPGSFPVGVSKPCKWVNLKNTSVTTMPVKAIKTISSARNGVGAFILQCKRLDFHYCNFGGSSRGMLSFLTKDLAAFAREHPQIEIRVSPRPAKHPVIKGHYINGHEKAICVRNLEPSEIMKKTNILKEANGEKLKRTKKPVTSLNESVRGIWSPYHGDLRGV
ncbi:54S ribosomal protein L51 [Penicillium cosmopolitanum]|uniref:Large ribosomal subunit protein mL43 n=2 Tax=Penicillium TaxID=5073 RepID=A0A9W9W2B5_9EURO|nr:54S ribosomal protein L51 [Penicillium cosmopolitanum]KAJ5397404.1 54S ribosomal protein L51 [Penicillium cosmopolitanum]